MKGLYRFLSVLPLFFTYTVSWGFDADALKMPAGFHIEIFADNIHNAREMARGDKGTIFVGTRALDKVYALTPDSTGTKVKHAKILLENLNMPNGVAFYRGALYVAENSRILRYDNIEQHLNDPPKPVIIRNDLPDKSPHGWRYIKFGPDGLLYIAIGAPCNICLSKDPRFATIMRMKPNGQDVEIFAQGIRNSVGFDWDPLTHELWFTSNGADYLGDDIPPDTLNHAAKSGYHFGYPFFHGFGIPDKLFGKERQWLEFKPPSQALGAHVASLGMLFYTGNQFPDTYKNQILIAEHGSWNRSMKVGYRVSVLKKKGNTIESYEPLITGWLHNENISGRPVDLLALPDGSVLISDDHAGIIYRLFYRRSVV